MFWTVNGECSALQGIFRGRSAFLVCSGPSLATHDLSRLDERGLLTMSVNNAATVHRPCLWTSLDDPGNFSDVIWRDPGIWKFIPHESFSRSIYVRDERGGLKPSEERVESMPAVFGIKRNNDFVAERWLDEPTFNWGNESHRTDAYGNKGSRSVMYVALKLLFRLGVRTIHLLGCDFRMTPGKANYAFEQATGIGTVRGNNGTYRILNSRLSHLVPHFEKAGLRIFNCTPGSGLTVFPHLPYERALEQVTKEMPKKIITVGMYERIQQEKDAKKLALAAAGPCDVDCTVVLPVTASQLDALRATWPTWKALRPELLRRPLLVVCDGAASERWWRKELAFLDHPQKTLLRWNEPADDPRARELAAAVYAANHVKTKWMFVVDPWTAAVEAPPWLDPAWFAPDESGRTPVVVGPQWGFTMPASDLPRLEEWGDRTPGIRERPRLNLAAEPAGKWVESPRFASWCCFVDSGWARSMARLCRGAIPASNYDTFWWYCAARRKDPFRGVGMKPAWDRCRDLERLRDICRMAVRGAPRPAEQIAPAISPRLVPAPKTPPLREQAEAASAPSAAEPRARLPRTDGRGVVYVLTGEAHAVRLVVSLHALRKRFDGPVSVYATTDGAARIVDAICADPRLRAEPRRIAAAAVQRNSAYITKIDILRQAPYEITTYLDADTLPVGSLDPLFEAAETADLGFTQFAQWTTTTPIIRERIDPWLEVDQPLYAPTEFRRLIELSRRQSRPALNLGVLAVRRGVPFLEAWSTLARAGWKTFISDEISCQLLAPKYAHRVLDCRFNCSPLYLPDRKDVRIWHFHGSKHLRPGKAREVWLPVFEECLGLDVGGISRWLPAGDGALAEYLGATKYAPSNTPTAPETEPPVPPMSAASASAVAETAPTRQPAMPTDVAEPQPPNVASAPPVAPLATPAAGGAVARTLAPAGVLTGARAEYWPLLRMQLRSCRRQNVPIAVVDHGLTPEQRREVQAEGGILWDAGGRYTTAWRDIVDRNTECPAVETWLKPLLCLDSPFERTIWIDADAVSVRGLAKMLERTVEGPWLTRDGWIDDAHALHLYRDLVETLEGDLPAHLPGVCRINTGVFGFRRGDPWLRAWRDVCERLVADADLQAKSICLDQSGLVALLAADPEVCPPILEDEQWNQPANGITLRLAERRKAYDLDADPDVFLKELERDHPQANVVHWMARPKPWDLREAAEFRTWIATKSAGRIEAAGPTRGGIPARHREGVLTGANRKFWPVLKVLVRSTLEQGYPVAVADHGLTPEQRSELQDQGVTLLEERTYYATPRHVLAAEFAHRPLAPGEAWFKPHVCRESPFERTLWIDSDAVPLRGLAEMFERLDAGPWVTRDWWITHDQAAEGCKSLFTSLLGGVPRHRRRICHINTGVFGFRRGDAWLDRWVEFCERIVSSPWLRSFCSCRDQSALLVLLGADPTLPVEVLDDPNWNWPANGVKLRRHSLRKPYDFSAPAAEVLEDVRRDHPDARVVHWVGHPKPWHWMHQRVGVGAE